MSPQQIAAEIERSILRCRDEGFAVRIRRDHDDPWQYIRRVNSYDEAVNVYRERHQAIHGIDSPYFCTDHKSHPAIVAYCAERLMDRLREGSMGIMSARRGQHGA